MNKKKKHEREQIVREINKAAQLYKQHLVGKKFLYTTSTATHTCQPVARSTKTAPAVQGGTNTSDTIDQTRNARRICFQFRLL